jgi:hypothetical protein
MCEEDGANMKAACSFRVDGLCPVQDVAVKRLMFAYRRIMAFPWMAVVIVLSKLRWATFALQRSDLLCNPSSNGSLFCSDTQLSCTLYRRVWLERRISE